MVFGVQCFIPYSLFYHALQLLPSFFIPYILFLLSVLWHSIPVLHALLKNIFIQYILITVLPTSPHLRSFHFHTHPISLHSLSPETSSSIKIRNQI